MVATASSLLPASLDTVIVLKAEFAVFRGDFVCGGNEGGARLRAERSKEMAGGEWGAVQQGTVRLYVRSSDRGGRASGQRAAARWRAGRKMAGLLDYWRGRNRERCDGSGERCMLSRAQLLVQVVADFPAARSRSCSGLEGPKSTIASHFLEVGGLEGWRRAVGELQEVSESCPEIGRRRWVETEGGSEPQAHGRRYLPGLSGRPAQSGAMRRMARLACQKNTAKKEVDGHKAAQFTNVHT